MLERGWVGGPLLVSDVEPRPGVAHYFGRDLDLME